MMRRELTIRMALIWVATYFGPLLLYTLLDIAIWRKTSPNNSSLLNLLFIILSVTVFVALLRHNAGYHTRLLDNITLVNICLGLACSILLYFLLDKGIDPMLETLYPSSELNYQDLIHSLAKSPITSFIQVCLIAPFIEEILMRAVVLDGLKDSYGTFVAIIFSSFLFALLHFNLVQSLSAFVCGLILGILFIKTDSILSCIVAHSGYKLISFITIVKPHIIH